jgi:hypothetical protein
MIMITYVHDNTDLEVTRTINVIDGPVRPQPYSSVGRKYRVSRAIITYRWTAGAWKVAGVKLFGTVLKADGSDSKNDAREHLSRFDTPPMWLDDLTTGLRPVGVPELPFNV